MMKKYLLSMSVVILALLFSAFTTTVSPKVSHSGEKWFHFNGTSPGDLNNPNKYSLDGNGSAPTICQSTTLTYRCEIDAVPQTGNPSLPDLSTIIAETKRSTP